MSIKTTVIIYDFDRIKNRQLEFDDLTNPVEKRLFDLRLRDMQDTIKSLESVFGGDILVVETRVYDKAGNNILIKAQPIALEVPYHLNSKEIDYVHEVDIGLIVVM